MKIRFSVYRRFEVEILRQAGGWVAYRLGKGIKHREHDLVIPPEVEEADLGQFLDDFYRGSAKPGDVVSRLPP